MPLSIDGSRRSTVLLSSPNIGHAMVGRRDVTCTLLPEKLAASKDLVEVVPKTDLADAGYRKRRMSTPVGSRQFSITSVFRVGD
jgi:hypothetical protein